MGKHFSEDSRVKIPALMHLSRLGYQYLSTKEIRTQVHKSTNIFPPLPPEGSEQAERKASRCSPGRHGHELYPLPIRKPAAL